MGVWTTMTREQRVAAVHFDVMNHLEMALLAGVVTMGEVYFQRVMTACTDGLDCIYDPDFWMALEREEARFTVCHENMHKGLRHCLPPFGDTLKKYPQIAGKAMDYVVNALLHQADPQWTWMRPPKSIEILLDKKYYGWSYPRVLNDLIKECEKNGGDPSEDGPEGPGQGQGQPGGEEGVAGGTFDQHRPGKFEVEVVEKIEKDVADALYQGQILVKGLKARSASGTGGAINVTDLLERKTDWRAQFREFVCNILRGNDVARWSRINSRIFAASGRKIILPTLYAETVGEVGIFADTSGSMVGIYPVLFGEVARIVEDAKPEKVTIIWWDTQVCKVQEFKPEQYGDIKRLLKPEGGGGTTPQVVADYVKQHRLKFQCAVWLTDGYIGNEPVGMNDFPQLWGVVDNEGFVAKTGKTVHIDSRI